MPNYMTELSPDNNAHVYQIKDKEAAPIDLLKDTVGWTGKNKAKSSFVTNNKAKDSNLLFIEGELESNKDYILSFDTDGAYKLYVNVYLCSQVTSLVTTSGSNKIRFTTASTISKSNSSQYNATYGWRVLMNSISQATAISLTNIMLREASITDSTFEPYHKSVEAEIEQVYADNGVLGASNFIYVERETRTYNGVTFTRIDDKSFSLSGTATGDANLDITRYVNPPIGRKYTYSIEEEGANKVDYIRVTKDGTEVLKSSEKSADIDISSAASNGYVFQITVVSGKTYNTTIKPMLTLASDTYKGFRPYAMTNRELTEMMTVEESAVTDIVSGATVKTNEMGNHLVKIGKVVTLNLSLGDVTATAWDTILFKIPKAYAPRYDTRIKTMENQMVRIDPIYNDGDARVKLNTSVTSQNVSVFATWITP